MSQDNGTSSGGGNSSVWLQTTGSKYKKELPKLANRLRMPAAPLAAASLEQVVTIEDVVDHPAQGEVKIGSTKTGEGRVEVHDTTDFDQIGVSRTAGVKSHPGMFRVVLRFKKELLNKMEDGAYKTWIVDSARSLPGMLGDPGVEGAERGDVFLVVHVPAIKRKPLPQNGGAWQDMPWEIHWEW